MTKADPLRWSRILVTSTLAALAVAGVLAWTTAGMETPQPSRTAPPPKRLFVGVDLAKLPERERIVFAQAETDFVRALNGQRPLCKAEADSALSDGGTSIFECKYYRLVVVHQIFRLEGGDGYLFGPELTFRNSDQRVSDVRYYSADELSLILKESDRFGF